MYFWKCWRDSRGTFLVLLGMICLLGATGWTVLYDVGGWTSSLENSAAWQETAKALIQLPAVFVFLASFVLGAITLGDEFSRGTLPFLLTRPRARQDFLWANWLVGAIEMELLALTSLGVYFSTPPLRAYPRGPFGFFDLRSSLLTMLVPLMLYSLTFFMTMLLRSGRYGSGAALLVVVGYAAVATWLSVAFDIYLPYAPGPRARYWSRFPWEEMASWLFASLLLAWTSRVLFLRREV